MNDEQIIESVINKYEGKGLSNVSSDRGGMTYRGISRKFFPSWEGWHIIDEGDHFDERLSELTIQFYKKYFWDSLKLSEVNDTFLQWLIFNFGINIGKKAITKKLQRILSVTVDGVLGEITLKALNEYNRSELVYQLLLEVADLYTHIVRKDRTQSKFLLGWMNRVMDSYNKYEYYKNTGKL